MNKLELKSGREKSLLNKHPWVFSGGVKTFPKAKNGEIVEVVDNKGATLGFGFYSPNSQIICRVFDFSSSPSDFQSTGYWLAKFNRALDLRKSLVIDNQTNTYRLIHAEGDFMPGIIVDVYGDVAVMQILIKGTELLEPQLSACLQTLGYKYIYRRTKTSSHELEDVEQPSAWLAEKPEGKTVSVENGNQFYIDIEKGQKTGFFIDQRDNRQLLKGLSEGKKVLNTFSYTGGFSVYALAGGASEVLSVDISKDAIKACDDIVALNFPNGQRHRSVAADCFDFLRKTDEMFDIVVLDPPAFAKNARSVPNACRGYKDLNLLGFKKVKPGGLVMTYSCSQNIDKLLFQKVVFSAAADAGRNVRIIRHLGQPADHPVNIFHPESEYLKGLLLWVE